MVVSFALVMLVVAQGLVLAGIGLMVRSSLETRQRNGLMAWAYGCVFIAFLVAFVASFDRVGMAELERVLGLTGGM